MSEQILFKFSDCELSLYSDKVELDKLLTRFLKLLTELEDIGFLNAKNQTKNEKT